MRFYWIVVGVLCACATPQVSNEIAHAQAVGMERVNIDLEGFRMTTFQRINSLHDPVRVYIEGDGYAWISRSRASSDPTPKQAAALAMAVQDRAANVVYLARPCQYSLAQSQHCHVGLWTDQRFSKEVIHTMHATLDRVMQAVPGQPVELVGYSGGAAIAVLLAAQRQDVASLRTVAGNLDHEVVNRYHHVSVMPLSLNPMDVAAQIMRVPQRHFVGGKDRVIPPFLAEHFIRQQYGECASITQVAEATHQEGWSEQWPMLLSLPVVCRVHGHADLN